MKQPVDQVAAGEGAPVGDAALLSQLHDGVLVPYETEASKGEANLSGAPDASALQRKLLLLIQPLPSHENLHLGVEGKRAVVLAEAVQQLGVLEDLPLVAN